MRRRGLHRCLFVAAGAWNIAWGARTALRPRTFYRAAGLEVPDHPDVAACLGMVVGLYGILYLDVARHPETGMLPAAVGLTGKVLGPAALVLAVRRGRWPARAFRIIAGNDLVWWLPFALYLHDVAEHRGRSCPDMASLRTRSSCDGHALTVSGLTGLQGC